MNKVIVKNRQGLILQEALFDSLKTQEDWINLLNETSAWGKSEHEICIKDAILDEEGNEVEPAQFEMVPSEYTNEIVDVSDRVLQEKINKEAEEYLKATDFYVIRMVDSGVQMPEGMQEARQAARDRIIR